jgi:NNP family nitrate/nitrite transporter-like MFS transporter
MPKINLDKWEVENEEFWDSTGKRIAQRNLWISIPSLLCGFAVWLYWSIITAQMLDLQFPFSKAELFTLNAIAGLTGATLRIPSSFLIRVAGGRNTIFYTTLLLIIPALGTGIALKDPTTPLWTFWILAGLSGIGGGNFASSMSNISFFFPKRVQGASLGLNAGLGNLGVSVMQILIPFVMTFGLFGALGGEGIPLPNDPSTVSFIQNAGLVWVPILLILGVLGFFGMNNIRTEAVSPHTGSTLTAIFHITGLLMVGAVTAAIGLYLLLVVGISKWIVLPLVIAGTVFALKLFPGDVKKPLQRQFAIFNNKHTWIMTIIYTMTFGSFIGYSAAFPLSIKVIFGFMHDAAGAELGVNPNAPNAFAYAWLGPLIGSLIRPVGGWISDMKIGGAKVTQIITVVMIASALGVSHFMYKAYHSQTPEEYFVPFLVLFLTLFAATGVGNGSTFRSMGVMFNEEQAGPVLGWTSAVAAYGAFIIPKVFGEQINAGTPQVALYGFATFYTVCLVLNWWFYTRRGAEIHC